MNWSRLLKLSVVTSLGVLVVFVAALLVVQAIVGRTPSIDGKRYMAGLTQYAQDLRSRGEPLPPSITLDELVRGGYLRTEDARPFEHAEVTFYTDADETRPMSVLMEARMPDGQVHAVLGDGSVQQFPAGRWQEHLKGIGQQDGAAKGSQPIRSETNRTSSAAGSRR